jgi:uncharacterized damage-inducible protein DinB
MDLRYLQRLIDFHYWARDRMLAAVATLTVKQYVRPVGNSFPSVRDTVNHLYRAEWVWFSRWQGASPTAFPPEDQLPDLETVAAEWQALEHQLRGYVGALAETDVSRVFEYRLINGTPGRSPFWEMVVHLVNHSTYHRGQVTTLLRQHGARAPESTDMITFFRTVADAPR